MRTLALVESNTSGTGALFARVARQLGFRPLLLTADAGRYAYVEKEGVETLAVDTQDRAALSAACRQLAAGSGLGGVTSSSEYFIATAAALAEEFGLSGPSPAAIEACRDKGYQRVRLKEAGVGIPSFQIAESAAAAVAAARALGLPVVVKPVLGTGSMQVRLCRDDAEVREAAEAILERRVNERGMPLPHRLLVESLATGQELSVETFGAAAVAITRKHLGPLPFFVEVGHDVPGPFSAAEEAAIRATALATLRALGLDWGPAHIEMKLTPEGPKIIEVNPRLAGGFIPELVHLARGVDLILQTVRAVAGETPDLTPRADRCASIRFLIPRREGVLREVRGLDAARALPGVTAIELYTQPGKELLLRGDFRDRAGHVISCAASQAEAGASAEGARDAVELVVDGDPRP